MQHFKITIGDFNAALLRAIRADDQRVVDHYINDFVFDEKHAMPKVDFRRASDFERKKKYGA